MLALAAAALVQQVQANPLPRADEGMWLPLYIRQYNEADAKKLGMRLSADDIYNINRSSVKDAILRLGDGFCTGEIVSNEGLVFTNHHCGYESIASVSTVVNDYLKNGFWAYEKNQEIPIKDLKMSRLVMMVPVTDLYKKANALPEAERSAREKSLTDSLTKAYSTEDAYQVSIKEYYEGNERYLLVYEVFSDIRLVGTPPSSVGKFGGDVDNWMWPRQTGDFSVFRIYVGSNNKPAEYSPDNKPYTPKHFLPVSIKGVKEGDFTFIMGFPGTTERYLTSPEIEFKRDYSNPAIIETFGTRMEIMKREMDKDRGLALKLASDYASGMNTYKYFQGQQRLLQTKDLVAMKQKEEESYLKWAKSGNHEADYATVVSNMNKLIEDKKRIEPAYSYTMYGMFSTTPSYGFSFFPVYRTIKQQAANNKKMSDKELAEIVPMLGVQANTFTSKSTFTIDKMGFEAMLTKVLDRTNESNRPEYAKNVMKMYKGKSNAEAAHLYVENMYAKSFMLDSAKFAKWLKKPSLKKLENDPLYKFSSDVVDYYISTVQSTGTVNESMAEQSKIYMAALRQYNTKPLYPDANSTLRFTYGSVKSYYPRDGVFYKYYTTHAGILEKSNKEEPDFDTPDKMLHLMREKKWGQYGENDSLRINFITNNDITGGNSGSPVMDADGNLVGLAFDGNWEAMLGDLHVDPKVNRTICVDVRYVLWTIDIYAGAKNLINELKLVR